MTRTEKATCNVGFIGCGALMNHQHIQNAHNSAVCVVHTLCDIRDEAIESTAAKFPPVKTTKDYRELLADDEVPLVVIAMRPEHHARFAAEALRAGKNVYVEKPLGLTVEDALGVARVVEETGRHLAVGFNRRFAPSYCDLKSAMAGRGALPVISYRIADFERGVRADLSRMVEELCHIFDILSWLTDSEPVRACATVGTHHNDNLVLLTLADGSSASILSTGRASYENPKERIEAYWDCRSASVEDFVEARFYHVPGMPPVKHYAGRKSISVPDDFAGLLGSPGGLEYYLELKRRFQAEWDAFDAGDPHDESVMSQTYGYATAKGWDRALDEMATATIEGRAPRNASATDASTPTNPPPP